ncbi:MAG: GDSL-type esterase/lipase family protein [Armatimonadota bacterium]
MTSDWIVYPATAAVPRFQRPGWLERHERYAARAAAGPIDLLFLGDSITQRWEGAPEVWERYYGHRRAVAMGIDNDGTQQLLWRLDHANLERVSPKLVVLLIGINNIGNDGADADELMGGITAVLAKIRAKCPAARVLVLGILPYGQSLKAGHPQTITETNARLARLADGVRVHFLDIGAHFLLPDGEADRALLHDGVHPSPAGYEVFARAVEGKVGELLEAWKDGRMSCAGPAVE